MTDKEYTVEWTFGTFLWSTLVFFFWFAVIWMFIRVFADIVRRDMSGWAKAGWTLLILALPFLGVLVYLIARPPAANRGDERDGWSSERGRTGSYGAADEISKASHLRDQGKISADEFELLKLQALSQ